jgi:hypothetical protein
MRLFKILLSEDHRGPILSVLDGTVLSSPRSEAAAAAGRVRQPPPHGLGKRVLGRWWIL